MSLSNHVEAVTASGVGVLSAVSAVMLQQLPGEAGGFTIPVVSALIGAGVSWGMMKATVRTVSTDVTALRDDVKAMATDVGKVKEKLSFILGKMDHEGLHHNP